MGLPATDTAAITTIDTVVDGIETHVHSTETKVDTIDTILDDIHDTHLEDLDDHFHSVQNVAPNLATGTTVTAVNDGSTWSLGSASGTILTTSGTIDIHHIDIYSISAANEYQLNLYDDGNLIAEVSFSKASVTADNYIRVPITTPQIANGSVITAKLASATNDGETVKVKIWYHSY